MIPGFGRSQVVWWQRLRVNLINMHQATQATQAPPLKPQDAPRLGETQIHLTSQCDVMPLVTAKVGGTPHVYIYIYIYVHNIYI